MGTKRKENKALQQQVEYRSPMNSPARSEKNTLSSDAATRVTQDMLVKEYQECNNNLRHYGSMRFNELTVLFAINAVLLSVFFNSDKLESFRYRIAIQIAGIFFSFVFGIMNRRRVALWVSISKRALEIEELLGFAQHKQRPKEGILSNRNAATAIYIFFMAFWTVSILLFRS